MPRYEVRLVRISSICERAYVEVEADDEYHAKALALEVEADELEWYTRDIWIADGGETEAEDCREVKDDQA
jgi:hypothetical protein